jgi:3-phenylpropionate/cinnamic acid dioxygenase small subunit
MSLREDVESLHARYAHALDEDRLEDWPNFFTEDGVYRIATAENEARGLPAPILFAQGRAMLRDRVASLRHANIYEPQRYRHIVSSVLLGEPAGDTVTVKSNFLVIRVMENGETTMFASGVYRDRISLPKMQYAERVVVCDSRRFDTLLAIPL